MRAKRSAVRTADAVADFERSKEEIIVRCNRIKEGMISIRGSEIEMNANEMKRERMGEWVVAPLACVLCCHKAKI